jgi:CRP-like cAMP-binding protein
MTAALRTPHPHAPLARPSLKPEGWSVIEGSAGARQVQAQDEAAALHRIAIRMHFQRNETIFSEGDDAKYSYKVVSGAIRLCKHLSDGRRQIAGFMLPGEFCGFMHLDQHRFTAEATGDTVLMAYPQRQIEALSEQMPSVQRHLNAFLAQRVRAMQDHLVLLGRLTARERVTSLLLLLAERAGVRDATPVPLPMSRQDMADYLGLTIETVCRVLSELKKVKLIELPELHVMRVKSFDALTAIAEGTV